MTDRVPGAPGQYKAVVTAEDLAKLQAAEQFTITLTRDDQPITEGTPYSKAAVLPDALAEKLCPGAEDPTPADALHALHARAEESAEHPGCYYRIVGGQTEWLNPPMETGTEYRTAKRHKGKVVYTIAIPIDIPGNTNGYTPYTNYPDIYGKMTEIVGYTATAGVRAIPARWYDQTTECIIDLVVTTFGIGTISSGADTTSATVTIEYTRD